MQVKIEEFLGLQTYNAQLLPYLEWLAQHDAQVEKKSQAEQQKQKRTRP